MSRRVMLCVGGLTLALFSAAALAQVALIKNDDVLRAEPLPTAASGASVKANAKVEIIERKGFWAKIKAGQEQGWLKLNALSIESGAGGGSVLAGLASGRTGSGNIVSASGTRGLSGEDLKTATPDTNALEQVKKLAVNAEQAQKFAQEGGLSRRQIEYIKPVNTVQAPAANGMQPNHGFN